jgi:hypothetical protein
VTANDSTFRPSAGPTSCERFLSPYKRVKCTAEPDNYRDMPQWYIVKDGKVQPFRCPECDTVITQCSGLTCRRCGWLAADMTDEQKRSLLTDPAKAPYNAYMAYLRRNDRDGRARRERKWISKISY